MTEQQILPMFSAEPQTSKDEIDQKWSEAHCRDCERWTAHGTCGFRHKAVEQAQARWCYARILPYDDYAVASLQHGGSDGTPHCHGCRRSPAVGAATGVSLRRANGSSHWLWLCQSCAESVAAVLMVCEWCGAQTAVQCNCKNGETNDPQ